MYPETLYEQTRQVLDRLNSTGVANGFYLAGGTGLALQIGHRKSIDLDFFAAEYPRQELLLAKLRELNPEVTARSEGTLDLMISGVKVSFLKYDYPLIGETAAFGEIQMAAVMDIACMKLSAISSRGAKKDFADMYFVLKKYPLEEIFAAFDRKFVGVTYDRLHLLKSLTFFDDAENDPEPVFLQATNWDEIKKTLEREVDKMIE